MKLLLIYLLMFTPLSWAQIETEKNVTGSMTVSSEEEAKLFLLHSAISETIKQYSTELGLDHDALFKKLDLKFEGHFTKLKEQKLADKFGKNYASELSAEQKKEFLDLIEQSRPNNFITYANLSQLLDSYSFKTIVNDSTNKTLWNGVVQLKLNSEKLERFKTRIMSDQLKQYSRIFLISEINLIGLGWADLGLEDSKGFSTPIVNSWLKWLLDKQPSSVEEIVECNDACRNMFNKWLEIPQQEGMSIPSEIGNSLWLKVSVNLRKLFFISDINEWKFEWDGSVVLLDANTKLLLASYEIPAEFKSMRGLDQKSLNSILASSIYRSPLDAFNKLGKKLPTTNRLNRLSRLVIQGQNHLGDVLSLIDLLRQEGQNIHLELTIDHFSRQDAQLLCFYQGEEKSFTDLLSRVKELKSSHSYRLVNEFTGVHHVLKLVAE